MTESAPKLYTKTVPLLILQCAITFYANTSTATATIIHINNAPSKLKIVNKLKTLHPSSTHLKRLEELGPSFIRATLEFIQLPQFALPENYQKA